MKKLLLLAGTTLLLQALLVTDASAGMVRAGQPAPDFVGTDSNNQVHHLSDYKGKYVVLEWHAYDCPWTQKYYSGAMQNLQRAWTSKGVVWLTIISDGTGVRGYQTPESENAYINQKGAAPTAAILDPEGTIGHLYNAQSTLHMFVISPAGKVLYNGAIDDNPSDDPADIPGAKNYVAAALIEAMAGKPVTVTTTHPYGCWIRYKDGSAGSALPLAKPTQQ
jgi:peroxiredoxin